MTGERLADLVEREIGPAALADGEPEVRGVAVKEAVFPFSRFDVDTLLGPEMRSTGEAMGVDDSLGMAFAKAQVSAGNPLPEGEDGLSVIVTVNDADKPTVTPLVRRLVDLGFAVHATGGTRNHLEQLGIACRPIYKVGQGRPHIVDRIVSGQVSLLINTPLGKKSQYDDFSMRRAAIAHGVPYLTTMSATRAAVDALTAMRTRRPEVLSIQERLDRSRRPVGLP